MFDKKTTITNPTQFVDRNIKTTITENRAPTDESIKILREMEKEAFKKVLSIFEVKNNVFSGEIIFMAKTSLNIDYLIRYKINGTEFTFKGVVKPHLIKTPIEVFELFYDNVAKGLVQIMLGQNPMLSKNLR